eukprot:CAMPEP_0178910296 /NCGR_PEP_ID=MMETSP0786-20121207/9018_1 /TAXON_ID=186022 /ORGANISM="Thalassionema frauenfeldii, Strain CCMP 1798" /LENGTH=249 /DNA_ID=CAMNT_0020582531 /DNA_START=23 /DNA_END=768 /DNA_ORIENTATION=+
MTYSDNAVQAASVAIRSIQGRKNGYEYEIKQNEDNAKRLRNEDNAKRFGAAITEHIGPALEEICSDEDLGHFLLEQKQRLVTLTEQSVNQRHKVDLFCEALGKMQQFLAEEDVNYEKKVASELEKLQKNEENVDMNQDPSVYEMKEMLGLVSENVGEEDAELEVIPTQTTQSLKCPLTASLYEDPVKSRVCNHVYSRQALQQYMQSRRGRNVPCPVAGCINTNLTMESCVDDPTSAMRVKKHLRLAARD